MKKEEISVLANITVAYSTFVGVAAATAYYLKQIRDFSVNGIIRVLVIYMLAGIFVLQWAKEKMRDENHKTG